MCETKAVNTNGVAYHCEGERQLRKAIGYDMARAIKSVEGPALRDALKHNPGKTQTSLINSRLRRLEREAGSEHGYEWCGVGRR